jgi:serine protease Do
MNNTQDLIASFQDVVIQISTPQSTGTGFYLKDYEVIVTNHHVVRGNDEVMVSGKTIPRTMSKVWFTDQQHDLAFLAVPPNVLAPTAKIGLPGSVRDGDEVVAIGHPFGLNYTATTGIVSKALRPRNGINYIQIDAAINPGNSGGPLINQAGEIVGVNTFIIQGSDGLGFALPIEPLVSNLNAYRDVHSKLATRCNSCGTIVTELTIDGKFCPSCGSEVSLETPEADRYKPSGVVATIEEVVTKLGKEVKLTRRGPNNWQIEEGSAKITIVYNTQSFFIIAYAYLCQLPKANISPLYEFLLRENDKKGGLTFSVNQQSIVLSCLIYDLDFTLDSGMEMFARLFKKADDYDNLLIETYGALPMADEG